MIDEKTFFHEATIRICGQLEIGQAMKDCLKYIQDHIPAESIYFELMEPEQGGMRFLAMATADEGRVMNLILPITEEEALLMAGLKQRVLSGEGPIYLIQNVEDLDLVSQRLLRLLNKPERAILAMPLALNDQTVGVITLVAELEKRFNEEHAQLLSLLTEPFLVSLSNAMKHQEVIKLRDRLADDNRFLHRELYKLTGDKIIGSDFGLKETMELVDRVASTNSPVLLLGETGVGKEVIANNLHYQSERHDEPFVTVNCGAIPENLIDSELFGHEKGAFTGALKQKSGRFERAKNGTIFLDEIGELPPNIQVRLLRVIQEKEFERVGGTATVSVDIRIIAATHRNLEEMTEQGLFREDLWFRLNVFPITIPPLRERKVDIPALVQHFMEQKSKEMKLGYIPSIDDGEMLPLMDYDWPGNVRELENLIERALILSKDGTLNFSQFLNFQNESRVFPYTDGAREGTDIQTLDQVNSAYIKSILEKTSGKIHGPDGAAHLLGINANTLRSRIRKLGIS
jgi:transcriptional regulator with GAF, ATPase, and Fis domain